MTDHEDPGFEVEAESKSPFDSGGRPFNDDSLNMSEFYYHDNPANNVGPYTGPTSYSINTVAPYQPPHGGEENPAQNVGPYAPPKVTEPDALKTAYKQWNDAQWFDGSAGSIYNRSLEAEQLRRGAALLGEVEIEDEIAEQLTVLAQVATEYSDSSLHELVDELPGGTVALEYDDLVDGGLVDITSFLSVGAHKVASEAAQYDWEAFKDEGARQWIVGKLSGNPGILGHEGMTRAAAVDYAKDKTMVLLDPIRRADIIDSFVTAAEVYRRQAAKRMAETLEAEADREVRIASARMQRTAAEIDPYAGDFLPGSYTQLNPDYDDEGYLAIGQDDGSAWFAEAQAVRESSKRPWEQFTTDGAREWFYSKASDNPAMLRHADITARSANAYAKDQTVVVPDQALRTEIVRAFGNSVEYLRTEHEARVAAEEQPQEAEIIFDGEDEILWF